MDIITCKNITVHNERTLALDDVTFSVKKGEFLTIVGENGAGKSTLVRVMLGILTPEGGEVEIDGAALGKNRISPSAVERTEGFPRKRLRSSAFG